MGKHNNNISHFTNNITTYHLVKGGLLLSITFPNGLCQSMSSANSPQNSSGSSIDFLNTSSYSRNTLRCCCELWKWRLIGRAVPQRKLCVCATFCHEFHRLWEQIFPCTLFKRAAVWIARSIAIMMCNPLISLPLLFWKRQQPTTAERDSVMRRVSRSRNWYTLSEPEGVKHDSHHVHHFKLMWQTLRQLFVQLDETRTISKHNWFK